MPISLVVHNSSPLISSVQNLSVALAKYFEWNGALTTKNSWRDHKAHTRDPSEWMLAERWTLVLGVVGKRLEWGQSRDGYNRDYTLRLTSCTGDAVTKLPRCDAGNTTDDELLNELCWANKREGDGNGGKIWDWRPRLHAWKLRWGIQSVRVEGCSLSCGSKRLENLIGDDGDQWSHVWFIVKGLQLAELCTPRSIPLTTKKSKYRLTRRDLHHHHHLEGHEIWQEQTYGRRFRM